MPRVRLLSLLSVVCAAAAVSVAAAPASAGTVLCKKAEAPCGSTQKYPGGTTINAALIGGTTSTFTSGFIALQCSGSTVGATTEAEAGSPLAAELKTLSFSGCTAKGFTGCTTAGFNLPTGSALADKGSGSGTFSLEGGGFEFTCLLEGSPVTCRYSTAGASIGLTGGTPASLTVKNVGLEKQSGSHALCSKTLTWTAATYNVSSPNPLFSSTGSGTEKVSSLCKELTTFCASGSKYAVGQKLEASASNFQFSLLFNTYNCTSATLKGNLEALGGESIKANFNENLFSQCTGSGGDSCVVATASPVAARFTSSGNGNGTLKLVSLRLDFNCTVNGAKVTCHYGGEEISLPFSGGNPALLAATGIPMAKEASSSPLCTATMTWSANYAFNQPTPLYLTN